jgi:hypothetical protein
MNGITRQTLVGFCIVLTVSVAAPNVRADDRETAGNLFDAGAEAYDAGQYLIAAEAFLKAHELLKSPALQFSAAQAYRRQYLVDSSPDALRRAVRLYRDYIRDDASGQRREEAVTALADLVPLEARLRRKNVSAIVATPTTPTPPATVPGKPPASKPAPIPIPVPGSTPPETTAAPNPLLEETEEPAPEPPRTTRVLISAKPIVAEISIDGGAFVHVPAVVEVKAGAHKIHAKADGYFDEDFDIDAVEKELVARHVALRPKPGRLSVNGVRGASLSLDGQLRAVLPLERPLDIEPGEHFLTVMQPGRVSFTKTVTILRDKDEIVRAEQALTKQRIGAWSMFAVGFMGAAATGVLGGLTWNKNSVAVNIDTQRLAGGIPTTDIKTYNNALLDRNSFATATAIAGGASALVLLTSVGLFLTDNPATIPVPQKKTDSGPVQPRVEMTVGLLSAGLRVDF